MLNLKQKDLARISGVSQSAIAKIESGKYVPRYDQAKKIFDALSRLEDKSSLTAKDIMTSPVIFVSIRDKIRKCVELMDKYGFSQIPVLNDTNGVVGTITDAGIRKKYEEGYNNKNLQVEIFMENPLPVVRPNTPVKILHNLLECYNAVLVKENDKKEIEGIITNSNFLKILK